jgi:glycosyltransferase involved in cell wall biosynthesis
MTKRASSDQEVMISVIIATMNCCQMLSEALDSVIDQHDGHHECIIIDGGSTDGTIDVIKSRQESIAYWISEPDGGISEAFNKGIEASTGRLLYFLGADDVLHDNMVFHDIVSLLPQLKSPYFFYGDLFYAYQNKKKLIQQNYTYHKFLKYNCIPHQAMFLDRFFFNKYGLFDTQYRYAMDYEHISRFIHRSRPQYVKRTVAEMRRYGRSSNVFQAHDEMDKIRLARGYATKKQICFDRLLLFTKLKIARLAGIDW